MSQINKKQLKVSPVTKNKNIGSNWKPLVGDETKKLLKKKKLSKEEEKELLNSSLTILSKGNNPKIREVTTTGLVVGYIQSGKTLSFTTVTALAHDNGYPLIIVVTGTSKALLGQSGKRLIKDLSISNSGKIKKWKVYKNPTLELNEFKLNSHFKGVEDPDIKKPTVLITVMKNHIHLKNLTELLKKINIENLPVLIIDDEADQASLNSKVNDEEEDSTTYKRLLELIQIPKNRFCLQYTATPQAPLLVDILDNISPDFCQVIKPGNNYVGGREFFKEHPELIKEIPSDEVPINEAEFDISIPPKSLQIALAYFFIGVASGLINTDADKATVRSMMIHPSVKVKSHKEYKKMVEDKIISRWLDKLSSRTFNNSHIEKLFYKVYKDLSSTTNNLAEFSKIIERLPYAMDNTEILEVNAGGDRTSEINFDENYSWILIGGQCLDRGFTVEGLTVTYMPRKKGIGNVDTLEQRGRFFGYRQPYLGYCRVFLIEDTINAFEEYVDHEEFMHKELIKTSKNKSLKNWKRNFLLSKDYNLCRNSVINNKVIKGNFANRWFRQRYIPPMHISSYNNSLIHHLCRTLFHFELNKEYDLLNRKIFNSKKDIALQDIIDEFLVQYKIGTNASDTQQFIGAILQLNKAIEKNSNELCSVYHMNYDKPGYRRFNIENKINNIFSGESSKVNGYRGDISVKNEDQVSIQIHSFEREKKDKNPYPMIAIWIPERFGLDWQVQNQYDEG